MGLGSWTIKWFLNVAGPGAATFTWLYCENPTWNTSSLVRHSIISWTIEWHLLDKLLRNGYKSNILNNGPFHPLCWKCHLNYIYGLHRYSKKDLVDLTWYNISTIPRTRSNVHPPDVTSLLACTPTTPATDTVRTTLRTRSNPTWKNQVGTRTH